MSLSKFFVCVLIENQEKNRIAKNNQEKPMTTYHLLLTTYYLPLNTYHLPLTIYHYHLPLAIIYNILFRMQHFPIPRKRLYDFDFP